MDFATNTLVGTITSPVAVRFIAYDEGSDAFWCGNWSDPPTLVSRTGTTLATITSGLAGQYGAAYDNVSAGGPFLWVFDQGAGAGTPQLIYQYDITSGTATGVTHDVALEFPANAGIAGGLFAMSDWQTGMFTLGGLLQGVPDAMFVYELGPTGGGGGVYFTDFESFVSGQQVACQDPWPTGNWTTWSKLPCGNEDALVSSNYAFSGSNSALIDAVSPRVVDLVKPHGGITAGTWYLDFMAYIPSGKFGYFNTLSNWEDLVYEWAFQAYFNAGGTGTLDAGGASAATFTFPHDTWFRVSAVIDLDADNAQLWINNTFVYSWQYTLGTFGTPCAKVIDANDFFGPETTPANNEMYIDDYRFGDTPIPVELTSFTAVGNNNVVELNWETATEINNLMFEIERRTEASEFTTIGYVDGAGTTTEPQSYSYIDRNVENGSYFYRLKQIDYDGTYEYSSTVEVEVTVMPASFNLEQNYPNPFNPSTSIKYSIPVSGNVRLSVYNLVGEEVAVLVNGNIEAGTFEVTFDASNLPSGVYLYKLQSANTVQTKKMMLLK